MHIRQATIHDSEPIAALIASFHHEITDHPDGRGAEKFFESVSADAERSYLASSRYRLLIAERNDELLGFIALRDTSHILHLFVHRQHQRHGVARLLWEAARSMEPQSTAYTVNSSLRAVPVYTAFGFKAAGSIVSGNGVSVVPMCLDTRS